MSSLAGSHEASRGGSSTSGTDTAAVVQEPELHHSRGLTPDEGLNVELIPWSGTWSADDPDANFKAEVADYGLLDPLRTLRGLSQNVGIPVGALARYVLARWATAGSGGLLELGPTMVQRLWEPVGRAEDAGTDEARLAAYGELKALLSWLKVPLDDPTAYEL